MAGSCKLSGDAKKPSTSRAFFVTGWYKKYNINN
jgi:hypothetical protein